MYAYRLISAPNTVAAARARAAELAQMFVFTRYVVAEVQHPDGERVDLIAITEADDGPYRTINAAKGAYIEACEARGCKVRAIDECGRDF
jgi:hypothetical protein